MKYYQPATLQSYFKLRTDLADATVTVLAGGTDLMPRYERGRSLPDHLIDLKQLSVLSGIQLTEDSIRVGALTTIQELHDNPVIAAEFKALHEAVHEFAGAQIRHRGTIGGNICNASPAGDLLPGLYAFDARLELAGKDSQRTLAIRELITGPGQTALRPGELVTAIMLPRQQLNSKFYKVGLRQSMAISVINLAVVFRRQNDNLTQLKLAAGAVAPTVVLLDEFTATYLQDGIFAGHEHLITEAIAPIDDIRATASYRRAVLLNLIQDFLKKK